MDRIRLVRCTNAEKIPDLDVEVIGAWCPCVSHKMVRTVWFHNPDGSSRLETYPQDLCPQRRCHYLLSRVNVFQCPMCGKDVTPLYSGGVTTTSVEAFRQFQNVIGPDLVEDMRGFRFDPQVFNNVKAEDITVSESVIDAMKNLKTRSFAIQMDMDDNAVMRRLRNLYYGQNRIVL